MIHLDWFYFVFNALVIIGLPAAIIVLALKGQSRSKWW